MKHYEAVFSRSDSGIGTEWGGAEWAEDRAKDGAKDGAVRLDQCSLCRSVAAAGEHSARFKLAFLDGIGRRFPCGSDPNTKTTLLSSYTALEPREFGSEHIENLKTTLWEINNNRGMGN